MILQKEHAQIAENNTYYYNIPQYNKPSTYHN